MKNILLLKNKLYLWWIFEENETKFVFFYNLQSSSLFQLMVKQYITHNLCESIKVKDGERLSIYISQQDFTLSQKGNILTFIYVYYLSMYTIYLCLLKDWFVC